MHPAVALVRQKASELGIWLVVVTGIAFVVGDTIRRVCIGPCVRDTELTRCPEVSGRKHPPGSPVPWILQARTLEWVALSFSNAGK